MQRFRLWGFIVLCCLPMGCNSGSPVSEPVAAAAETSDAPPRPADAPAAVSAEKNAERRAAGTSVTAQVMKWDEAQKLPARYKGRVVVVDVWSTDCVPCRREFPNLVALQKEHGENIACISINVDFIGLENEPTAELREDVLRFLREQNAVTENVICSDPVDSVYERVDFVSIPAVYVYDKSGTLKTLFKNDAGNYGKDGFTYGEHITPLIRELLADSSGGTVAEQASGRGR